jgi:lipopolysaccharide/colanic/teichoic acid biosynthesis glycosyltransferase
MWLLTRWRIPVSINAGLLDLDCVLTNTNDRLTLAKHGVGSSTESDFRRPEELHLSEEGGLRVGGSGWYEVGKTSLDFIAAGILVLLSLPFVLVSALIVRLTSHGPAFYTQMRLGRHGKPYVIYKLRSMYHDCERHSGIRWSSSNDSRVTPFGWFLRRSHIDELPQLWNVLRGEMSLIGPRPERPELVVSLEKALPCYRDRLLVKPGLTGLAQIQLPPDTDIESVRKKLALDRVYVHKRSLWLDLRIYVATVFYLGGMSFDTVGRWFALPSNLVDEKPMSASSEKPLSSPRLPSMRQPIPKTFSSPMLDQV